MYGTLLTPSGFSKEDAKTHLDKALDCAYQLNSEPDIAQDRNYQHLFYALFAPGSEDELDASEEAKNQYNNLANNALTDDDKRNATRNLFYLKRQQALAWYRALLVNGHSPVYKIDDEFLNLLYPSRGAEDWVI